MWAFRRASVSLRSRGLRSGASRACCVKLIPTAIVEDEAGISESQILCDRFLSLKAFYHTGHTSLNIIRSRRELSSQADARSKKEEDDLDYELGTPVGAIHENDENDDELISEQDLSCVNEDVDELHNELELSDTELDSKKKSQPKRARSELFKEITKSPATSVNSALAKWVKDGKEISRSEISSAMVNLRALRMYGKALQLSEWVDAKQPIEYTKRDYTSRLDLIAKVRGLLRAKMYLESIPEPFREEQTYRTLLANCVSQNNMKIAVETFSKILDLELPLTTFACNQMLLLYKRTNKRKIADILSLMEKEKVKPSHFTYKILIDTKGSSNDIAGMEQVVEMMKAEGTEPDIQIKLALVRHYVSAGLKEKAQDMLKEMEGENLEENRWVCRYLFSIYAKLGKADEVERVWRVCKSDPRTYECLEAIEAWGNLKKIEEAEAVFEMMMNKWEKLSSRQYAVLLRVYAQNKMLNKGKDLIKRMANSGCRMGPFTWDALVRLYVQAGEVEKADSLLQKAIDQNQMKPMYSTYLAILDQYARRGDIQNSEKIFFRMRQAGYISRLYSFKLLVQTYINAKVPAYGIRERVKAENILPNKAFARQLDQVDVFKRTAVSDLLD